jgi:hypothetical protein
MRTHMLGIAAAAVLAPLLPAACGGSTPPPPAGFTGHCTMLAGAPVNGLGRAEVDFTNTSGVPLTISGFTTEGWNNGARVGDATTNFKHPRHVRPGHTQKIVVLIDGRTHKCDVAQFLA